MFKSDSKSDYKYTKYKQKYLQEKTKSIQKCAIQKGGDNGPIELFVKEFFIHKIQIKMAHFQTKFIGYHTAYDGYLVKFNANFDRMMEAMQHMYRLTSQNMDFNIEMFTDENSIQKLSEFENNVLINQMNSAFAEDNNPDILAIRDEMVADIRQLKYLLSFK